MKKLNVLIIIFLIPLVLFVGCSDKYENWQSISIPGVGVFKVPQEWVVTQKNNMVYITDKPIKEEGYKTYLLGIKGDDGKYIPHYDFFENVEYIDTIEDVNYSNSATYWLGQYKINGNIEEKYVLHFYSTNQIIDFLAWDNLIDKDTIIKIAKSYVME